MIRRFVGIMALLYVIAMVISCAPTRQSGSENIDRGQPPTYQEVTSRLNERAVRLSRIWANATAQFSYLDEDGDRHNEQGEGHFQFIAPDQFGLSIGKLSDVLFWLGCDSDRYWFFQMYEGNRVSIGRNANIGKPCSQDLGLPASPIDIIDLLGVTPLDPASTGATSWSNNGKWLVVDAPGRLAWRRLFLDPVTFLPARIELYDPDKTSEPVVIATIEEYDRVVLDHFGGVMPKAPSRIQIDHPASETSIRLFLHNMNDGKTRGRLSEAVFSFESLVEAFGPEEITVLDQFCPEPAIHP